MAKKELIYKYEEWIDLCTWVEREIFQYNSNMHIGKKASLVLSGLRHGQAVANNGFDVYGDYPLNVIKMTFIMQKAEILKAMRGKEFKGEEAQMKYVCAIIRDKIPNVYLRWLSSQKSEEKVEAMNTDNLEYQGAEYKIKTETKTTQSKLDDKFKELW